ncbi:hypothetical protein [Pseudomonas saliphila]|uniref:hypothetical protein n=1 Tax=Pseudomonas saliphila TaxID=2586906 RepID=UPI0015B55B41|nr:hypothetical protein [Pseudomonas saliphila]
MHTLISAIKWLFCSGHEFCYQPVVATLPTECPARSECLGCDGKINCHLARLLTAKG